MKRPGWCALLVWFALLLAPALAQTKPAYVIQTVAGAFPLGDGGPATSALLEYPGAVAVDRAGNIYVADDDRIRKIGADGIITTFKTGLSPTALTFDASGNLVVGQPARILRITPGGAEETIAGTGVWGSTGDNGPAKSAMIRNPSAIAVDTDGTIYFADESDHKVRKIAVNGTISTLAGTGEQGYTGDNSPAKSAKLNFPGGVAVDGDGNVYIADRSNRRIRKVAKDGTITLYGGDGNWCYTDCGDGSAATKAQFSSPAELLFDRESGTLYVADSSASRVRAIGPNGVVRTFAGSPISGFSGDGGMASLCRLFGPSALAADGGRNVYIADTFNHRIRKVTAGGVITSIAGKDHFAGDGGAATAALLQRPNGVAVDKNGVLYVSDTNNHRIRRVAPDGTISTYAGTGINDSTGDGGPAANASLGYPGVLALDSTGNLYVSAANRVRKISPAGVITAFAGSGICCSGTTSGGPATEARFNNVSALAVDSAGKVYIADQSNYRVWVVASDGTISAFAGTGTRGGIGDGGLARSAQLSNVYGLAVDKDNNVYIADGGNNRIRKVTPAGIITTAIGSGRSGLPAEGAAPDSNTNLNSPNGIAIDNRGNLYVSLPNSSYVYGLIGGKMYRIAGNNRWAFGGDGGFATAASLRWANNLAVDGNSDVFLADSQNNRVRKLVLNSPAKLEIGGGNGQTGAVGQTLPNPITVRLTGRGGLGVPEASVLFEIVSGSATLSTARSLTDPDGVAGVAVTLGGTAGNVVISASVADVPAVRFTLTATAELPPPAPVQAEPRLIGLAGAGLSNPLVREVSPAGLVSIFGENLGAAGTPAGYNRESGRVPTTLGGVCVQIGNTLAPIMLVSEKQLLVQIPQLDIDTEVDVQAIRNCGEAAETKSNTLRAQVRAATPEFWHQGNALIVLSSEGKPLSSVKPDDTITILGTGFGATSPATLPGEIPVESAATVETPVVTIGETEVPPENVVYCGVLPGMPGMYQVTLRVPADVPEGSQPIQLRLGAFTTPGGDRLTIVR
ncbi:MAG: hypothetical protein ACE15B_15775 [Bryobacteraceae bacterium]